MGLWAAVLGTRVTGALVTGSAAVLHGHLLHQFNLAHLGGHGFVAWLGLVGFVVVGAGIVVGTRRAAR